MQNIEWWYEFLPENFKENLEELCKLLNIAVKRIHYNEKLRYFCIDSDFEEEKKALDKKLSVVDFDNDKLQWTVILSNTPDRKFYDEFIDEMKTTTNFDHDDFVHRGHYLASMFKRYLVPEDILLSEKDKVSRFFGKGNIKNIYYQSAKSNCNSATVRGQSYFENEINNFLRKSSTERTVMFQIQDYRIDNTSISHGRRLLAIFVEDGKIACEQSCHVYIPNVYENDESIPEPIDD